MAKFALFAPLEAKPGQEEALAAFLKQGEAMSREEAGTVTWYAIRFGPSSFAIFDTFDDEAGRQAHLTGDIAEALMANAETLLASPPEIKQAEIIGQK
jgi:quinol monooxygenase YgiN